MAEDERRGKLTRTHKKFLITAIGKKKLRQCLHEESMEYIEDYLEDFDAVQIDSLVKAFYPFESLHKEREALAYELLEVYFLLVNTDFSKIPYSPKNKAYVDMKALKMSGVLRSWVINGLMLKDGVIYKNRCYLLGYAGLYAACITECVEKPAIACLNVWRSYISDAYHREPVKSISGELKAHRHGELALKPMIRNSGKAEVLMQIYHQLQVRLGRNPCVEEIWEALIPENLEDYIKHRKITKGLLRDRDIVEFTDDTSWTKKNFLDACSRRFRETGASVTGELLLEIRALKITTH